MTNILYGYNQEFDFLVDIYNKKNLPNKILFSGKKVLANHYLRHI